MESRAYTQCTAASKKTGKDSRAATVALIRWALLGQHLDSMQDKSQHVSSIPVFAGFHKGQADGIDRTAMGSAVGVMVLVIEYWDRQEAASASASRRGRYSSSNL
jgi:hypothetical protein